MKLFHDTRGETMVESMVSLVILSMVLTIVGTVLAVAYRVFDSTNAMYEDKIMWKNKIEMENYEDNVKSSIKFILQNGTIVEVPIIATDEKAPIQGFYPRRIEEEPLIDDMER